MRATEWKKETKSIFTWQDHLQKSVPQYKLFSSSMA